MAAGAATAILTAALIGLGSCASSKVDPRCAIAADGRHRARIAMSVNGSDLWQEYFQQIQPSAAGARPLVVFQFTVERTKFRSYGGDYDPGRIAVDFKAKSARNGRLLFKNDMEVNLQDFMIGRFDRDATRDEIQEIAFLATEERVYPYLDRWVNLAAIRAMQSEGLAGGRFIDTLNELIEDQWTSGDMRAAAREALRAISGQGG